MCCLGRHACKQARRRRSPCNWHMQCLYGLPTVPLGKPVGTEITAQRVAGGSRQNVTGHAKLAHAMRLCRLHSALLQLSMQGRAERTQSAAGCSSRRGRRRPAGGARSLATQCSTAPGAILSSSHSSRPAATSRRYRAAGQPLAPRICAGQVRCSLPQVPKRLCSNNPATYFWRREGCTKTVSTDRLLQYGCCKLEDLDLRRSLHYPTIGLCFNIQTTDFLAERKQLGSGDADQFA